MIVKFEQRNRALAGAEWLAQPAHSEQLALDRVMRPQLERLDVARVVDEVVDMLTSQGRHQALLDQGLGGTGCLAHGDRNLIQAKVGQSSKYTPAMLDRFVTNRFVDGVLALLHEIAGNPQHEVRSRFDEATRDFIAELRTSPEYRERGDTIKQALLEHLQAAPYWRGLACELRTRLVADLADERSVVRDQVASALTSAADAVRDDAALQRKLNGWTLEALESLMVRHRHQVSLLISDVVKGWDAREVSDRVEMEIGKDLQFIRINGTLVGGMVGLLPHAVARLAA